jgi:hypothetical protein
VNLTLVSLSQNEEVKSLTQASIEQADEVKMISAWAAILFAPTLVSAVYGMNFDHMPELHWPLGYPFALALMLVVRETGVGVNNGEHRRNVLTAGISLNVLRRGQRFRAGGLSSSTGGHARCAGTSSG